MAGASPPWHRQFNTSLLVGAREPAGGVGYADPPIRTDRMHRGSRRGSTAVAMNDLAIASDDADGTEVAAGDDQDLARRRLSARLAAGVFAAYLLGAFVYLIIAFDDRFWFIGDDWGMLVDRSLSDPVGWFTPQNSHWSTVPTVSYVVLFKLFGLRTYLPYAIVVMVAHLVLVVLLRLVMRRAGVGPWTATIVAATFVLYGTGQQNIWFAIQISMVTSMVCGVGHLLLADHDGPFDRRDALGLAVGAVGIMASGVGPPLVAMVGLAVLIRRGWRLALIHTVPLAALYGLWSLWQKPLEQGTDAVGGDVGALVRFVRSAVIGVFEGIGQHAVVAALLAVLLVAGLVLAWAPLRGAELRRRMAAPLAMVVGGLLVLASAGSQRYLMGEEFARSSRYVAMGTALVLPALAVAAAGFIQRWRYSAPIVLGLVVIGVPGNIAALGDIDQGALTRYQAEQEFLLGAAQSPTLKDVAPDALPYPGEGSHQVTAAFLLQAKRDGRLPEPPPLTDKTRDKIETRLLMSQSAYGVELPGEQCRTYTEPIEVQPDEGERFAFDGAVVIAHAPEDADAYLGATSYSSTWSGRVVTTQRPHQKFQISAVGSAPTFVWCTTS